MAYQYKKGEGVYNLPWGRGASLGGNTSVLCEGLTVVLFEHVRRAFVSWGSISERGWHFFRFVQF